ncbi:MAG: hypothetical protein Q8P18_10870 [Pseudomonadota bacterium]|nr:hypothetical protein [Pseudomonadota bacterium]
MCHLLAPEGVRLEVKGRAGVEQDPAGLVHPLGASLPGRRLLDAGVLDAGLLDAGVLDGGLLDGGVRPGRCVGVEVPRAVGHLLGTGEPLLFRARVREQREGCGAASRPVLPTDLFHHHQVPGRRLRVVVATHLRARPGIVQGAVLVSGFPETNRHTDEQHPRVTFGQRVGARDGEVPEVAVLFGLPSHALDQLSPEVQHLAEARRHERLDPRDGLVVQRELLGRIEARLLRVGRHAGTIGGQPVEHRATLGHLRGHLLGGVFVADHQGDRARPIPLGLLEQLDVGAVEGPEERHVARGRRGGVGGSGEGEGDQHAERV